VFFSAAFFGKDTRSNGTTATETEHIILNSSTQTDVVRLGYKGISDIPATNKWPQVSHGAALL